MKKIIFIYFICIVAVFLLPVFLVKQYSDIDKIKNKDEIKIKLLISETNEIREMNLEDYIMGVLVGEMPVDYNIEALKAQAIVARTYTLNKLNSSDILHSNANMCDNINHCQAYKTKEYALSCWDDKEEQEKWNKIKNAVLDTSGLTITYNGELINAFFHANSGGITEDISNIWGHESIPYLISVNSNEVNKFSETVKISLEEINEKMKEKYSTYEPIIYQNQSQSNEHNLNDEGNINGLNENIKIVEINSSGRVSKFKISNIILDGTEARTILGLRSTLFTVNIENENIIFETKGYGHGIGMSQYGANDMANSGSNYEEIIKHYYTGVEIEIY